MPRINSWILHPRILKIHNDARQQLRESNLQLLIRNISSSRIYRIIFSLCSWLRHHLQHSRILRLYVLTLRWIDFHLFPFNNNPREKIFLHNNDDRDNSNSNNRNNNNDKNKKIKMMGKLIPTASKSVPSDVQLQIPNEGNNLKRQVEARLFSPFDFDLSYIGSDKDEITDTGSIFWLRKTLFCQWLINIV